MVEEPYSLLEEEGFVFATPPALEDYEAQLERSLECMKMPGRDILFDRCPADFVAYALSHEDAPMFDMDAWMPRVRSALQGLDLVVFVPLDDGVGRRIREDRILRRAVDERLREILVDDLFATGILEVRGALANRVQQVLERVR